MIAIFFIVDDPILRRQESPNVTCWASLFSEHTKASHGKATSGWRTYRELSFGRTGSRLNDINLGLDGVKEAFQTLIYEIEFRESMPAEC
jgi:hypothetical protein